MGVEARRVRCTTGSSDGPEYAETWFILHDVDELCLGWANQVRRLLHAQFGDRQSRPKMRGSNARIVDEEAFVRSACSGLSREASHGQAMPHRSPAPMWTWRVVSNGPLRVSHAARGFEGLQPAMLSRAGFGETKKTIAAQL
jgi:hypothetical protein